MRKRTTLGFDEYDIIAEISRRSFYEFVKEFWDTIVTEEPVWNWHIEFLCDELQDQAERVFAKKEREHDLIINIPPGTTKSTVCSIMFAPWTWTRMPTAKHINASHTHELVLNQSRLSRDIVQSQKYRRAFPDIVLREDQNTKGFYANTRGGYRLSCTVGGKNPMGFHAHFITVDDPIDPQKAVSDVELTSANNFMTQTVPSRKVNKAITVTSLIMQRLHQDDPSGHLLDKAKRDANVKIRHLCLPAEESQHLRPERLRKKYKDGLLDPIRLDRKVLAQQKATLGSYAFAGQYDQHPIPSEGAMFKVDRFKLIAPGNVPPLKEFKRIVRYWDNAGTDGGQGAYTAGVKVGLHKSGNFYILHAVRGRWESDEREAWKKKMARMDSRAVIIGQEVEPGSSGKDQGRQTMKNLNGFRVKLDRVTGPKEHRADNFAQRVNEGLVYLVEGEWNMDFIDEYEFFPNSRYKDQVDAGSGAYNLLTARTAIGAR